MKRSRSKPAKRTAKVLHHVIADGKMLARTQYRDDYAEIISTPKANRKAAWRVLMDIGPVEMKPRK